MQMTPVIAVHMTAALGAVVTGPVALWARRGAQQRPRLHRAFGYAWVTLMLVAALSALFIRDYNLPNIAGYTPIHLLVPLTLSSLVGAFRALARGDIAMHRKIMTNLYISACLVAGAFTLLPGRYLGGLFWGAIGGGLQALLQPHVNADSLKLVQLLAFQPQAVTAILKGTPVWVWGLLAALVALGLSQVRDRTASLVRVSIMPVAMGIFSLVGIVTAFGRAPGLGTLLALWLGVAALVAAVVALGQSGATYDSASRRYTLPGSWVPLVLIAGIFLTKYAVGIELAMQPQVALDRGFVLPVAALYGVFTGLFTGRAARLWRLALQPAARPLLAV